MEKHNFPKNLIINNQRQIQPNYNINQSYYPQRFTYPFSLPLEKEIKKANFSAIELRNIISSYGGKINTKYKKRNYDEFMKEYKEKNNYLYIKEKDLYCKLLSFKESKIKLSLDENNNNNSISLKFFDNKKNEQLNQIRKEINNLYLNDSFNHIINIKTKNERLRKNQKKKSDLNSSYLIGEYSGLLDELNDTKESSTISFLNFSYDYPELSLDNSLTGKLITNAIELEKTFNKYFDVKNMPNKK